MSLYFFDTEFQESGNKSPIIPISIGIVKVEMADIINPKIDKVPVKKYYAVSNEFDENNLSDWLKENVVPTLNKDFKERKSLEEIKNDILKFVGDDQKPVFFAYYADYDWVVFAQIFGAMIDLPEHFPMLCMDLKQIIVSLGNPKVPEQKEAEHNALNDAMHNALTFIGLYRKFQDKQIPAKDLFDLNLQ